MAIWLISIRRRNLDRVQGKGESVSAIATCDPSIPKLRRAAQLSDWLSRRKGIQIASAISPKFWVHNFKFRLMAKTDLCSRELGVGLAGALKPAAKAQ
jgi:hypothetical protein